MSQNPLIPDRDSTFLLHEVHDAQALCALPYYADHDKQTFDMTIDAARRFAREQLFPAYKPMDEAPPELVKGELNVHPMMKTLYPRLVDLGLVAATRPYEFGGQQLPSMVSTLATAHLMAGNAAAVGYAFLTTGAAHLIESFGDDALRALFLDNMYSGRWTGTMALTEPHAGSSLGDITTTATPLEAGRYSVRGSKIFISGGQHDLTENIVHLTLARIDGAPAGVKGVSLFAVPRQRPENGQLVDNDVHATQAIHKIGWRGLPSLVMDYGDEGSCVGWLVGQEHCGLKQMFQMMNEARILVGANAVATASVAYRQSLIYAQERPQGRATTQRDPAAPQVSIIEHTDVRRMLLRQKAIVEGGLSLVVATARAQDLSEHGADEDSRSGARKLLDILTPITKTFPSEWGYESNALALQIHGGYGYSSEYLPESFLRDQKLNSIHEGTTGIQGLDLLGRKVIRDGGKSLRTLLGAIEVACGAAPTSQAANARALGEAAHHLATTSQTVGARGMNGDVDGMLRHSTDFLFAASAIVVAWQWLKMATVAQAGLDAEPSEGDVSFYSGKLAAADHWFSFDLPMARTRLTLIESGEDSYARVQADWF
ncbi:MAG: alkylation response protein AidB-like acyl-CoA dehydrogenase [Myxococcota bacterium]|jgi:alkylation response protein AidB-like acyl-CoA dehydrogenase